MKIDDVKNICVVGAGNMGQQISLLCALSGYKTTCTDISPEVLSRAEKFADDYLLARVKKGKMTTEESNTVRTALSFTADLKKAAQNADFVIEAVLEQRDLKRKIFADLDRIAPAHAILATNSSMIVSSTIADATERPSRVINMHFFNPALVMKLVEVVKGHHVSDETAEIVKKLCERLSKIPIMIYKEVDGFVLNRILVSVTKEALWMLEMGVASAEDIDKACIYGAGYPMGPFQLLDLTGNDVNYDILMSQFRESGNTADYPAPSLVEKYVTGQYGKKTGRGWYKYDK
ncbi:MAG: 3-hydroxyacyl-CoA dehydrogenase family protein [Syntrophales bacterium]